VVRSRTLQVGMRWEGRACRNREFPRMHQMGRMRQGVHMLAIMWWGSLLRMVEWARKTA
jgi:hypothetical protein